MDGQPGASAAARSRPGGRTARVREQVLRATVEVVASRGVEGLRYDEVARTAGVNRATLHRNWPDRDELIREAILHYAEDLIPVRDTGDISADLTEFLSSMAKVSRSPVGQALMRAVTFAGEDAAIRELGLQTLDRRLDALQTRIDDAVRSGDLPPVDATFLNEMLTGPVHLHIARARRPFGPDDARRIVGVVLAGIRATAWDWAT
ncbi:MAG: hypothetical protein QG622_799 [Actinomycetota bacterium]|nr:hypothetical protein [Actinomycetota bacterium]